MYEENIYNKIFFAIMPNMDEFTVFLDFSQNLKCGK